MPSKSIVRRAVPRIALTAVAGVVAFGAACGGGNEKSATDTASNVGNPPPSSQGVPSSGPKVTDIRIGTKMDSSKQVTRQTDIFTPKDTLFASVHLIGAANTQLTGRWTFQDGKAVDEQKQSVNSSDSWNGFQSVKSGGWPLGTYTFHVLIDGQEVQRRDVMVK